MKEKPNFVMIYTDDQGYRDFSRFGGEHVYIPNIDAMAEEGARLTSFYVAALLRAPSRKHPVSIARIWRKGIWRQAY